MARATLLLDYRQTVEGGFIVTVGIWRVPDPLSIEPSMADFGVDITRLNGGLW